MPTRYPELSNKAWIVEQYEGQGLSTPQIAAQLGCNPGSVQAAMRRFGIKARGRHYGRWNPKVCERCGKTFTPSGPAQRFCDERCRLGTRPCEECGVDMMQRIAQVHKGMKYERRFCSRECRLAWMEKHATGRYDAQGYVLVKRAPTQSRTSKDGGYIRVNMGGNERKDGRILEHRLVMSRYLGRPLYEWETVHHIDGNRANNDITNLQLRIGKHGKYAAYRCMECGSNRLEPILIE